MFPRRGAVAASTGKGNGWLLGAALANDLGVGGDASPVMEGVLLNLSRKFFIPATNGMGGFASGACSNAARSPGGGAVSPRSGASFLAAFSFGESFQQPTARLGANCSVAL